MITQKYMPMTNNLALIIKKEHRLTVFKKVAKVSARISIKALVYAIVLTVFNILV